MDYPSIGASGYISTRTTTQSLNTTRSRAPSFTDYLLHTCCTTSKYTQTTTMTLFTTKPPTTGTAYAIPQLEGERITIPGSKGTFRILASSKQTNGLMAVFQSGAVLSDAPGFHYHNHAHDVFLVTKGFLKLWNGDKCRLMGPGDFAYVPPVQYSLPTHSPCLPTCPIILYLTPTLAYRQK